MSGELDIDVTMMGELRRVVGGMGFMMTVILCTASRVAEEGMRWISRFVGYDNDAYKRVY